MSTSAETAAVVWAYETRTLASGTPGTQANRAEQIAEAVWEYATRTLTDIALDVADAYHAQVADSPDIAVDRLLELASAYHLHVADSASLARVLALADCYHRHDAEVVGGRLGAITDPWIEAKTVARTVVDSTVLRGLSSRTASRRIVAH